MNALILQHSGARIPSSFICYGFLIRKNFCCPDNEFVTVNRPPTVTGRMEFEIQVPEARFVEVSSVNAASFVGHETTTLSPAS